MEISSSVNGKLRYYWTDAVSPFSENNAKGVRLPQGASVLGTYLGNLNSIRFLRIDPLERPGEVIIKTIRISQPGFDGIRLQNEADFKQLTPVFQIQEMIFENNGLKVISSGMDPQLLLQLKPRFRFLSFAWFVISRLLFAFGTATIFYFSFRILLRLKNTRFRDQIPESPRRRQLAAHLIVVLILAISGIYYAKWAVNANYKIRDTSQHIGERLPPNAFIAGVGAMAITINNRLKTVKAPDWYEDNQNIFNTYPITHLFISPYAGYLNWYKNTFPEIMANAEMMGKYRVVNIDFFLFKINSTK